MDPIISANFYPRHIEITSKKSGISSIKNVSMEQFREALNSKNIKIPLLPLWTVAYNETASLIKMITVRKTSKIKLKIEDLDMEFDFPYFYIYWTIRKIEDQLSINNTMAMCSFGRPSDNTRIYIPYVSNVDGDNGKICWGDNGTYVFSLFNKNQLGHIRQVEDLFFTAEHNYDYVSKEKIHSMNGQFYKTESEWVENNVTNMSSGNMLKTIIKGM